MRVLPQWTKKTNAMLAEVEKLMDKGEHRTAEEDTALELMVRLITDYEEEHHPCPTRVPTKCCYI